MALFTKNLRKHIFVHPAQQKELHGAVKSALMKDKRKYSDQLEGALLNVSNVRVVGNRYLVVDGFLSMEVEANFQVFCPTVGMSLDGVVNKISKGHIGCLVMDLFNASIAIPPSSAVSLEVGNTCEFSVTDVIIDADILSLRGSLLSVNGENIKTEVETECEFNNTIDNGKEMVNQTIKKETVNEVLFAEGVLTQSSPPTKKSPKKKKEIKLEHQDKIDISVSANIDNCDTNSRKRTKSHKKAKDKVDALVDLPDGGDDSNETPPAHVVKSLGDQSASPSKKQSLKGSKRLKA